HLISSAPHCDLSAPKPSSHGSAVTRELPISLCSSPLSQTPHSPLPLLSLLAHPLPPASPSLSLHPRDSPLPALWPMLCPSPPLHTAPAVRRQLPRLPRVPASRTPLPPAPPPPGSSSPTSSPARPDPPVGP